MRHSVARRDQPSCSEQTINTAAHATCQPCLRMHMAENVHRAHERAHERGYERGYECAVPQVIVEASIAVPSFTEAQASPRAFFQGFTWPEAPLVGAPRRKERLLCVAPISRVGEKEQRVSS